MRVTAQTEFRLHAPAPPDPSSSVEAAGPNLRRRIAGLQIEWRPVHYGEGRRQIPPVATPCPARPWRFPRTAAAGTSSLRAATAPLVAGQPRECGEFREAWRERSRRHKGSAIPEPGAPCRWLPAAERALRACEI